MKILMLGWELPPHNSGGLGIACYQLCKALAGRGIAIEFALPYQAAHTIDFMQIVAASDMPVETFQKYGGAYDSYCYSCNSTTCQHATPHDLRAQQQRYTAFVEQYAPTSAADAIHMHDWLTFEAGMRAKVLTGKPLIAHVHATEFDRSGEHYGNPLVHDIEYAGLCMADRIIAVSQLTKDLIVREYAIPADKIEVAHNSIEPEELSGIFTGDSYAYVQQMKAFGYVVAVSLSRLTVQKGLTQLLRAAQLVIQRNPKVLFVIAGEGEQRNELLELSADLGISQNVIFTGFVRGQRWRDAYAVADMFIMSSVSEPFGLTALEAAGHGNALLLSKQSGVREVLHNVLTFDYWDTARLADQVLAVAEYPVLQHELAYNARREFDGLSWARTAHICQQIYGRALQPKGSLL